MDMSALVSYHTHTTVSDGLGTFRQMVEAAQESGLGEFGFSDHFVPAPPSVTLDLGWAMERDQLGAYVSQVQDVTPTCSIPIRLGLEVDYFPETWQELPGMLAAYPFDYLIGSVHITDNFPIDCSREWWDTLTQDQINAMYRLYWKRVGEMAETGLFDIAGHLDLPKKFDVSASCDLRSEITAALKAIAQAGMAIELNTSGWDKPCEDPYPTESILREAKELGIPVIVSADAHAPEEITRHYARACDLLLSIGHRETVRFKNRERFTVPLS